MSTNVATLASLHQLLANAVQALNELDDFITSLDEHGQEMVMELMLPTAHNLTPPTTPPHHPPMGPSPIINGDAQQQEGNPQEGS